MGQQGPAELLDCRSTVPTTIYRYGFAAWIWRLVIGFGLAGVGVLLWLSLRDSSWMPIVVAAPLFLPALFFGFTVATEVVRVGEDEIRVQTLLFWKRRLAISRLGRGRVRTRVEDSWGAVHAPRVWIPVAAGLPVHLDLLATIPDPQAFQRVFGITPKAR